MTSLKQGVMTALMAGVLIAAGAVSASAAVVRHHHHHYHHRQHGRLARRAAAARHTVIHHGKLAHHRPAHGAAALHSNHGHLHTAPAAPAQRRHAALCQQVMVHQHWVQRCR